MSENDGWGIAKDTIRVVSQATFVEAHWDVVPDSIRLFLNCENPLTAPAQPHKGQAPIRFSAIGASVRLDAKSHQLLIVPFAPAVTLWAYRSHTLVFKHEFKTVPPPLPKVECFYGGPRPTDLKPGEEWPRATTLKALPASEFSSLMPNDARYRVWLYQVTYLRNNIPLALPTTVHGPQSSIENPTGFQPGDELRVDVQLIQRMNFCGDIEDLPIQKQFFILMSSP